MCYRVVRAEKPGDQDLPSGWACIKASNGTRMKPRKSAEYFIMLLRQQMQKTNQQTNKNWRAKLCTQGMPGFNSLTLQIAIQASKIEKG